MARPNSRDQRDLRYRALADPTRRHLLRILDDADVALQLDVLAQRIGLHVNTIRGHLDLMEEAGLVGRSTESRQTPGRPRVLFHSMPRDTRSPTGEGYRFLAEILASSIQANENAALVAEEAGRAWGRYLADRPPPSARLSSAQAIEQVLTTFVELGFEPESLTTDSSAEIRLHDCPFHELARTRGEVVCSVHKGLLQGMLEEMGGSVGVDGLEPFVEPSLCVARISQR